MNLIRLITKLYTRAEFAVVKFCFSYLLAPLARTRLDLVRRLSAVVRLFFPLSIVVFAFGLWLFDQRIVMSAGLLMSIAGVLKLTIRDEWEGLLSAYNDEVEYPYGPPSYVTREMFTEFNPEALGEPTEENEAARYLFERRGLIMVLLGFLMQLLAAFVPVTPVDG